MSMKSKEGHGWVKPHPLGLKARCGGPALCADCQQEQREYDAMAPAPPMKSVTVAELAELKLGLVKDSGISTLEEEFRSARNRIVSMVFSSLVKHYVQRADDRQKAMGLQYTEAETRDLAEFIAKNLETWREP